MSSPGPGVQPFLVYANFPQKIKLSYPSGWTVVEDSNPTEFIAGFASPREGPDDPFSENLNLLIQQQARMVSLDEYVQANLAELQQFGRTVAESTRFRLAGLPAQRVVYNGAIPGLDRVLPGKYLQYWTVNGSKTYVATYTAQAHKYEKFLPVMEQLIASLEIIG